MWFINRYSINAAADIGTTHFSHPTIAINIIHTTNNGLSEWTSKQQIRTCMALKSDQDTVYEFVEPIVFILQKEMLTTLNQGKDHKFY
jgi:hypothetical protein